MIARIAYRFGFQDRLWYFRLSYLNHAQRQRQWNFWRNMNDVIFFPPLGGAVNNSRRRTLVGRSRLHNRVHQKVSSIIHRFRHNTVFICKPERRLCDNSARRRCIQFSMTDFDNRQHFPKTYKQKFHLQHALFPRQWCLLANWNWRHGAISARRRCTQNLKTDSVTVIMVSY